jgi:hypothetical protein
MLLESYARHNTPSPTNAMKRVGNPTMGAGLASIKRETEDLMANAWKIIKVIV